MKSYIQPLFTLLAVLLFTACSDFEDYDRGMDTKYPAEIANGYYTSKYNAGNKYDYAVVVTEDAQGNKVIYTQRTGKDIPNFADAGKVRTTAVFTDLTYDAANGILTASVDDSFYEDTTSVTLAYRLDGTTLAYELAYGRMSESAQLEKSSEKLPVQGKWNGVSVDSTLQVSAFVSDPDTLGQFKVELAVSGQDTVVYESVAYNTELELPNHATMAFNEKCQMVYTQNEQSVVLNRVFSDPEPEQFLPLFVGNYKMNVSELLPQVDGYKPYGGPLLGEEVEFETVLYQSDKDPSSYIIAPFIQNPDGMAFTLNDDLTLSVVMQYTGLETQAYGSVYATDLTTMGVQDYFPDYVSHYDSSKGVFYFDMAYHVSAGTFGYWEDTFTLTEEAARKKVAPLKKENLKSLKYADIRSGFRNLK